MVGYDPTCDQLSFQPYTRRREYIIFLTKDILLSITITFVYRNLGFSGSSRARTCDLLVNGQLLYQLSYTPVNGVSLAETPCITKAIIHSICQRTRF